MTFVVGLWAGCIEPPAPIECTVDTEGPLLVAATAADDYSAGSLVVMSPDDRCPRDASLIEGDAVVDVVDDAIYVVHRYGHDVVRRYDDPLTAPTWEIGTGSRSNPYAAVGVGDRLVIPRLHEPEMLVIDATDGSEVAVIDASDLADDDEIPELAWAVVDGDQVVVAVQRLAEPSLTPTDFGMIMAVDPATATRRWAVEVGPNPRLAAHPEGGVVVSTTTGWWRVTRDGSVAGPEPLTGSVEAFTVADDGAVYALTRDCPFDCPEHWLVCKDAWDGPVVGQTDPERVFMTDVLVYDDTVWLSVRRQFGDPGDASDTLPGGFVPVPREAACDGLPDPDTWIRSTFPPFNLEVRGPVGAGE